MLRDDATNDKDYVGLKRATEDRQEGQHPLTGQHAANVRLLANQ